MNDIDRLEKRVHAICVHLGVKMDICYACSGTGWKDTKNYPCACCVQEEGGDCSECKGTGWLIEKIDR